MKNVEKSEEGGKKNGGSRVFGYTEVRVDSRGNKAPYYVVLVADEEGKSRRLVKTLSKPVKGEAFDEQKRIAEAASIVNKVGVIGGGKMGCEITSVFLDAGFNAVLKTREASASKASELREKVQALLSKSNDEERTNAKIACLEITDSFGLLADCGLVVECVVEDEAVKKKTLAAAAEATKKSGAIIASNTSAIPIKRIAPQGAEERTLGMHFFNPPRKMRLVEIVKTQCVSSDAVEKVRGVCIALGKTPLVVKDSPGFIVNRLMIAQLEEAQRMAEEGVASQEEIDTAVQLGLNHPMGPFRLIRFIGPEIVKEISKTIRSNKKRNKRVPQNQP